MVDRVDPDKLKAIVDGALLAAGEPLSVDRLAKLFKLGELHPKEGRDQIRQALKSLEADAEGRGYVLRRVASGYRYQVRQELSLWVSRLWDEKPPRYSRALMETLALVAYKQPVTRGDIEQIRGVSVSPNIMRTLLERGWVKVVGQREVPGRPSLYGTTRAFLDYFDLKSLDQLPPLAEIRELLEPMVIDDPAPDLPVLPDIDDAEPEQGAEPVRIHSEFAGSDDTQAGAGGEDTGGEEKVSAEVVPLPTAPHTSGGTH